MARFEFTRPVYKDGTLTDYAKMLLEMYETGAITLAETRRMGKYMTYQGMKEGGLIKSVKIFDARSHEYRLTAKGIKFVEEQIKTKTPVIDESIKAGDTVRIIRKGSNWNDLGKMDHLLGTKQKVLNLYESIFIEVEAGIEDHSTWVIQLCDVEKCSPVKELKKVKPADIIENLKQQIKEAEAKLDKIQKDSEEETYRKLINGTVKVKIKESYKGKYDSLRKFPLHVFRVNDNGMAKCAISDSGAELTFEIHYSALEPINRATIRKMFTNFY